MNACSGGLAGGGVLVEYVWEVSVLVSAEGVWQISHEDGWIYLFLFLGGGFVTDDDCDVM